MLFAIMKQRSSKSGFTFFKVRSPVLRDEVRKYVLMYYLL